MKRVGVVFHCLLLACLVVVGIHGDDFDFTNCAQWIDSSAKNIRLWVVFVPRPLQHCLRMHRELSNRGLSNVAWGDLAKCEKDNNKYDTFCVWLVSWCADTLAITMLYGGCLDRQKNCRNRLIVQSIMRDPRWWWCHASIRDIPVSALFTASTIGSWVSAFFTGMQRILHVWIRIFAGYQGPCRV